MSRDTQKYIILDEKAATGHGTAINCKDYKNAVITIVTTASANFTVKAAGSIQGDDLAAEAAPNFAAASTPTNQWSLIQMIDYNDGATVDGDTGVSSAGTDISRTLEMNINGLEWIDFNVTDYVAGKITVKVLLLDNQ